MPTASGARMPANRTSWIPIDYHRSSASPGTNLPYLATNRTREINVKFTQNYSSDAQKVACRFPHLLVDDHSLKPYLKMYPPLQCAVMKNWVFSEDGKFYISADAAARYGHITCDYYDIYRKGDSTWDETVHTGFANGSSLLGDVFRVQCRSSSGHQYRNLHVGVVKPRNITDRLAAAESNNMGVDVLIYLIDSISRINFIRKLPKFYTLLTTELDAIVMEGFNIVGDGTPWSLIPITTGHFQTELHEARKRFKNATFVDDWPLIFKDFKKAGYMTSYAEEQPQFSFFSYKLTGFKDEPVDHYLRRFEQASVHVKKHHKPYCLGDTPRSLVLLKWWKEKQDTYRRISLRTFSLLFSSETSHDDYNYVQVLDEHWTRMFQDMNKQGYFNKTLVLVMGDHGRRFGPVRQTQSGKMEEKLPFLAFLAPPELRTKYPKSFVNLKKNSRKLVTPFDLHETLVNVVETNGTDGGFGSTENRGISLFKDVPASRSCRDAWIKPHFCSCLDWEDLAVNDSAVSDGARFAIDRMNGALAASNGSCVNLTLGRVVSARRLHPNSALMAFKESKDYDNIFPDFSANAALQSVIYQLRFVTRPNDADFEVSLDYFIALGRWTFSWDTVSRLNIYGNQPHCVLNTLHHLRAYCVCRDKVKV
jgi:hypothetical protein